MAARPYSAGSRRAWGSMAYDDGGGGGAVNPAMDDDDLMPAAMESDVYASKPSRPVDEPPPQQPPPTGCWASFTRGLRGKTASIVGRGAKKSCPLVGSTVDL